MLRSEALELVTLKVMSRPTLDPPSLFPSLSLYLLLALVHFVHTASTSASAPASAWAYSRAEGRAFSVPLFQDHEQVTKL